ncbi:hypothetical protein ACFLXE_00135 [Chloroflexota bacterium]
MKRRIFLWSLPLSIFFALVAAFGYLCLAAILGAIPENPWLGFFAVFGITLIPAFIITLGCIYLFSYGYRSAFKAIVKWPPSDHPAIR